MKGKVLLLLIAIFFVWTGGAQAKKIKGEKTIYMFGVSVNIKDSTACISTPQPVAGAQLTDKGNLLAMRTGYTQQYKAYVDSAYSGTNICAVFFATSQKEIEKQWNRVYSRKQKEKELRLVSIPTSDFSFKSLNSEKTADEANSK